MSRFRPSRNYISGEVVFEGGPVDISGDLIVSGTITANEYQVNVINTNVTHIDADGNTKFGDSPDDTHIFTGSVFIVGALSASSIVGGGATTPGAPNTSVQYNDAGAFAGDPNFTWNDGTSTLAVTGDISGSGNISGSSFYGDGSNLTNLPSAAITTYDTPGDDRIVTSVNATTVQGEADLTFDGTTLAVTGDISGSGNISGSFFYGDGSNLTNLPGGGSPGGSNTQIQFNDGGTFGGDSDLTWDKTSNILTITGSTELNGPLISSYNSTKIKEVSSQSDFDQPLVANTSYVVRGEVTLTTPLTASTDGISIEGNDRNVDKIIWAGASGSACIKVEDAEFSLSNVGFSSSVDGNSILSASNYAGGTYNEGRLKVFSIVNCQFRGCSDIADFIGFDLIDISNTLFWYSTAPSFGLRFSSTSKTEISSCEFIRWFDESEIPSPVTFASASMIELMPTGSRAGFGAVNINGCVLHPQLSQNGIKINAGSSTGFGTIAANTFVDANLGPGLKFFPDPLAGGYSNTECLKYDIAVNQGIPNSNAYMLVTFVSNATDTALSSGTPAVMNAGGNATATESQRMTSTTEGVITYTGTKDINVSLVATINFDKQGGGSDNYNFMFYKDSGAGFVQLTDSVSFIRTGGNNFVLPMSYFTSLSSGDQLAIYIENPSSNDDMLVTDLQWFVKE